MYRTYITLIFSMLFLGAAAQPPKIQLRPSLGWGRSWSNERNFETNSPNYLIEYNRLRHFKPYKSFSLPRMTNYLPYLFQLPQVGLELEYLIDKHHSVGIGFMHGKAENIFAVYRPEALVNSGSELGADFYNISAGNYQKFLLSYAYNFKLNVPRVKLFDKVRFGVYTSIAITDLDNTYYDDVYYVGGNRPTDPSFMVKTYNIGTQGIAASLGFKMSIYNFEKSRERFSVLFLYDKGFDNVFGIDIESRFMETIDGVTYDRTLKSAQKSNGDQFKVAFSYPINLDFIYKRKNDKKINR